MTTKISPKIAELSTQQRAALMVMSATAGLTTKQIAEHVKVKNITMLLDTLRNRGLVRSAGHFSPSKCKWTLTEMGAELQKQLIAMMPN